MNKLFNKKITGRYLRKEVSKTKRYRKLSDILWGFDIRGFETGWRSIRDGNSVIFLTVLYCAIYLMHDLIVLSSDLLWKLVAVKLVKRYHIFFCSPIADYHDYLTA